MYLEPLAFPIRLLRLQQVGPAQRQKLARLQSTHRGVARRVGEQGSLTEQGAGAERGQVALLALALLRHDLHPAAAQQVAGVAYLALPDYIVAGGERGARKL